jgi:hypothetical protein
MELFVAFAEESENVRTVTIISNPGTDSEKTDTVRFAKGLQISLCPDFTVEKSFTLYSDAACTQILEEYPDVNSDLTVYVKWDE